MKCAIVGCEFTNIDARGPASLRVGQGGNMVRVSVCEPHWSAIMWIVGASAEAADGKTRTVYLTVEPTGAVAAYQNEAAVRS